VTATPNGYGPADLQSAYALPSASAGAGNVFAIVDAYDDPTAEADLGTYRSTYGLSSCTTANGCFRKVGQTGTSALPRANGGWAQEISLDLDMASAVCPNCKILLVEANSNAFTDLAAAEDTAARLGASVISNSYGGSEFSAESTATYNGHFNHPGIPITVSSGDAGYGVEFPAASQYVTAVGGTSLTRAGSAFTERAWSGAGSGCSAYIAKPSWQTDGGCARRTVADVSAVADPNTGVAVYDSYKYRGAAGWMVFGGTSASAPIVAGVYALAGDAAAASYPYSHTSGLHDVTTGSNGTCSVAYLCTAGPGFDGPTGLGTPNGASAF
jgi:subtilase family serine protease